MNKYLPYILILLLAAALVILFITGSSKVNHRFDERITLRKPDKIPYGSYVAYRNLKYLFPGATISGNRREPGYWDSLSTYGSRQLLIIISPRFYADEFEMKKLIAFVESGNYVFISTRYVSLAVEEMMGCQTSVISETNYWSGNNLVSDSLNVSLLHPPFADNYKYNYPGAKFSAWAYNTDTGTTEVIGKDVMNQTDFIHLKAGKGDIYMQLAPLAFSNYFLLHKNNIGYYENALSLIPQNVNKVVWDEYYLYKRSYNDEKQKKENWLSVLFRYPALKAALLTAIFTLLLFVLMEMRRKQRYIAVVAKPRNDSLDFVRTIGRLYHDKGDHKNLCRKMGSYFLEHVRNRYKLPTGNLDEEFVKSLKFKTGCEESEIRGIVSFIKYIDDAPAISHSELTDFHKHLESFYKKA